MLLVSQRILTWKPSVQSCVQGESLFMLGVVLISHSITVYKGLKESGARPGQTVAIVGAGGGLGSIACQYAKAMGLKVIGIDAGDKKEAVKKLGAYAFVDFKNGDVVKEAKAATPDGLGPHAVLLVAVNEKPFQEAADVSAPQQRYLTAHLCSTFVPAVQS